MKLMMRMRMTGDRRRQSVAARRRQAKPVHEGGMPDPADQAIVTFGVAGPDRPAQAAAFSLA
ncbi:MAG TPA: hypothetical protein VMR06_07410 [Dokdonella sp.]|uniref:hypothetical protein n=1 Tax=Dokdonella sp. TaxID=2291710 RepID=UPI002D187D37|nr:hypothetical protein [Dokdonella sp.]HUD41813.1 hypothetical protein [Dokdonella sp.]